MTTVEVLAPVRLETRFVPPELRTDGVNQWMLRLRVYPDEFSIRRSLAPPTSDELDRSAAEFLPTLAPGQAVLIGVAFPIPLTLQILPPNAPPDSKGPRFQDQWAQAEDE